MTANASDSTTESGIDNDENGSDDDDEIPVWLVERTYSDDELNLIILVYATEDGRRYHRRERALTSFSGPARETSAGLVVSPADVGTVDDPDTRERYAEEASRMAERHDPNDSV
ncbi:hypothetical protein [Natrinema halophilum]|uniref:DUF7967 domain-containing protein n=1 Tax=Natrinema halophilum TaxID=1699371 RepID=A0A7D5H5Z4_9EURY|nr:hypothetical protein [Natrinema halophilum]QLG48355.1 hypothetical protein HYG82_05575 [Natrinema halophilum]